ncbi:hypothetical protein ACFLVI_00380 [Chloroflexota bacterium]
MKMKWKGLGTLTAILGITMLMSVVAPALAQSGPQAEVDSNRVSIPTLGIKAPDWAPVGEEITITVFDRQAQEFVEDAGVWAVPKIYTDTLRPQLNETKPQNDISADYRAGDTGFQSLAAGKGKANNPSMVKSWARNNISAEKHMGSANGLKAASQTRAMVSEPQMLKAESRYKAPERELDYESLVESYGIFLGTTGTNGSLDYAFSDEGGYLLVAMKEGYRAGYTTLAVQPLVDALAIRAPQVALVGEEVTMAVYHRQTSEPIGAAGVWALSLNGIEAIKSGFAEIKAMGDVSSEDYDYGSLLEAEGIFLGRTDMNGELTYTFDEVGRYLLVTWKEGYTPGFSFLAVKVRTNALEIMSPPWAPVGTEITLTVFDRYTLDEMEGAGIWALPKEIGKEIKAKLAKIRADDISFEDLDYQAILDEQGTFLGRTDISGELTHTFDEAGRYLLVTWKAGYAPDFASLGIKDKTQALDIMAPAWAPAGIEVTITVFQKHTFDEIADAGIWALPKEIGKEIKAKLAKIRAEGIPFEDYDYQSIMDAEGTFLGRTGIDGELTYTFDDADRYLLVTWKVGHAPDFASLGIREPGTN